MKVICAYFEIVDKQKNILSYKTKMGSSCLIILILFRWCSLFTNGTFVFKQNSRTYIIQNWFAHSHQWASGTDSPSSPRACERNFPMLGLSDSDQRCRTAVQIHTAKHLPKSSLCQQKEILAGYK